VTTTATYPVSSADDNFILSRADSGTLWLIVSLLCADDVTITKYYHLRTAHTSTTLVSE